MVITEVFKCQLALNYNEKIFYEDTGTYLNYICVSPITVVAAPCDHCTPCRSSGWAATT